MRRRWLRCAVVGCLALVAGCSRAVRPDDMSAEAHRREAAKERSAGVEHLKHFDPQAEARVPRGTRAEGSGGEAADVIPDYNPTRWNLPEAERHGLHAIEHESAAAQLEQFEAAECGAYAPRVRAACPFIGPVRSVEEIKGGIRLRLAPGAPVEVVAAHMRCHLAYARSRAFAVSECPLSLRGSEIATAEAGTAIDITSDDRKTTKELRRRAAALVAPAR